jgi:hypothetical protein
MSYQNISVELPDADVAAIETAIALINSKLPFLVNLEPSERQQLIKLGPKSADFVADAAVAVEQFPGILPVSFNKAEFTKDTTLFKKLYRIKVAIDSLAEKIDNTYVASGSESMEAGLQVYLFVQAAASTTPGLQSIADKMAERFKGQGKRKSPKPLSQDPV